MPLVWSPKSEARRLLVLWPSKTTAEALKWTAFIFQPYFSLLRSSSKLHLTEKLSKASDLKTSEELIISVCGVVQVRFLLGVLY